MGILMDHPAVWTFPRTLKDATAILWREIDPVRAVENVLDIARPTAPSPSDNVMREEVKRTQRKELVPAAIMRGHSGSHVWRLAIHEVRRVLRY